MFWFSPAAQTFIKTVNYQHMMPTRYTLDVDLKTVAAPENLDSATKKEEARKVGQQLGYEGAGGVGRAPGVWGVGLGSGAPETLCRRRRVLRAVYGEANWAWS